MKQLIENFPAQIHEAVRIAKKAKINFHSNTFTQVVVSGLGGSGIGGSIVQEYVFDKLAIPFSVNKGYTIPKSVNANTLFIACSYSGNTEETLQAVALAKQVKATIVCVTSGGELAKFAKLNKYPLIEIPGGMPPRACLGYSLIQLLYILKYAKLIKPTFEAEILSGVKLLEKETKAIQKSALTIASKLVDKEMAIYTTSGREGLVIRFRQQLNENSKVLGWTNVIPEMTHNEIVGWKKEHSSLAVVYCYHKEDNPKNLQRLQLLKKVVKKYNSNSSDIIIKGGNYWEQAFYFIHFTDWVSLYLSELNHNDPVEVKVIDFLKSEMTKK